jgi:hypothetical protein
MAVQLGVATRNARLDAIEGAGGLGTSPIMTIKTGAQPANCATANSGTVLATITLPSDWMAVASGGTKTLSGTWTQASANAGGQAAHFRIHTNPGNVCEMQGSVSNTGGGGDLKLDNDTIVAGQTVTITAFTLTDGNA